MRRRGSDLVVPILFCPGVLILVLLVLAAPWKWQIADLDGRRCAKIGPGRHRRDVAGIENVGAGAGCACAARTDISGYGHRGAKDAANDVAHGRVQTAGRVHLQNNERRVALCRRSQATQYIVG